MSGKESTKKIKLAIVGGRDFTDKKLFDDKIFEYLSNEFGQTAFDTVVTGCAKGADQLARELVEEIMSDPHPWYEKHVKLEVYKADWDKHGRAAGPKRNQQIVDAADMVIAFWDGKSRGTCDTISRAKRAKKDTIIIYY